jgi:hypothetical protein
MRFMIAGGRRAGMIMQLLKFSNQKVEALEVELSAKNYLIKSYRDESMRLRVELKNHRVFIKEQQRLVKELDILINGVEGAADQASLCDIVAQVYRIKVARGEI